MAVIKLGPFGGELPQLDEFLLPARNATEATNCKLWNGTLRSMYGTKGIKSCALSSTPEAIFRYQPDKWFEFAAAKDIVRSLAPNDSFSRVYWTGDGTDYPKVTDSTRALTSQPYPAASLRLGVPAPTVKPGASLGTGGSGTVETRYYVYTYVNSYGEESPPSPISDKVTPLPGQQVNLTFTAPPGSPYDITKIYIYRSNTIGTTAVYQYVDSVTLPTVAYTDTKLGNELREALASESWDPPPSDMVGIINAGGFIVGFRNNELLPSELNLPHAYPVEYRKSVDYKIVGLGPIEGGFVVATEGQPYIATGAHPAALALSPLEAPYACLTRRGIVAVEGAVIYPSTRGLVRVTPGEATLITDGVFDQEDWDALNPTSIKACRWRNLYLAFYTSNEGSGAFVIDPFRPTDGVAFYAGVTIGGLYTDLTTDIPYVAYALQIAEWDAGAPWPYNWISRPFELSTPNAMHLVKVHAVTYPVMVTVYCEGKLQARVSVGDAYPVRIPSARRGRTYKIQISGFNEVRKVWLASTMTELAQAVETG